VSRIWRQTITDELGALVDNQRGALTIQEYTLLVLAQAVRQPSGVEQRVSDLEQQINELRALLTQSAPVAKPTEDMLSF